MTRVLAATPPGIELAAKALLAGRLVAFPTETVYGLGALATSDAAVARIFEAKGRPAENPLILHVWQAELARRFALFDERAVALASAFWPGPMTLVLPLLPDSGIAPAATAGLDTVAVRVPRHPAARALLRLVAAPVAAPSANRSGRLSPTTAGHVMADLAGRIDILLDGGPVEVGIESTVIDLTQPDRVGILRPGGLARDAVAEVVGEALIGVCLAGKPEAGGPLRSPGLLDRHYAPRTPLRLDALAVEPGEALLAFGERPLPGAVATLNLSPAGDVEEAARNLYAMLHELDGQGASRIAVMKLPRAGLGEAIADRLRRASQP